MTLTRDQLRAARALLHLRQDTLSELSQVKLVTIRRFETGSAIRPSIAERLRTALTTAGAVLIDDGKWDGSALGAGVALLSEKNLPPSTRARIAEEQKREAERIEADRVRREIHKAEKKLAEAEGGLAPRRAKGRPKKGVDDDKSKSGSDGPN